MTRHAARFRRFKRLLAVPENRKIKPATALGFLVQRITMRLPVVGARARRTHSDEFLDGLHILNDTLESCGLRDRCWLWGGLLLGWAREGRILPHDVGDADFCYASSDDQVFDSFFAELERRGYRRWFVYRSSTSGEISERVFLRKGSKFEFFRMTEVSDGDAGKVLQFSVFTNIGSAPVECVGQLPEQKFEPVDFIDRTWTKPADHAALLELHYGDWRTPDPNWDFRSDGTYVSFRPWL
ncbi:MAG: hypothetical protein OJJ54_03595 [Pseudonocardia sp.]|nr:hypothetical protein [Pseudonocardia sp.]